MTELRRPVVIDRIGGAGQEVVVEATPSELAPIAARLMIPAVNRLSCRFHLRRAEDGVVDAHGTLSAEVVQDCVVTLEPFAAGISEPFAIRFVPEGRESEDDDPDSPDEIPYAGGSIDLGEAAVEQLALALDPYPRGPDAAPPADAEEETKSPFAGLAALRRKQ